MTEQEIDKFVEDSFSAIKSLDDIGKLADARKLLYEIDSNRQSSKYTDKLIWVYMMTSMNAFLYDYAQGSEGFTRHGVDHYFTKMLDAMDKKRKQNA